MHASFSVRVVGHGPPMLLLPGLACSDDVWREAITHYRARYELHLITLAGFAGQPAIEPPFLPTVASELVTYIREHKLQRPILIGHSLGAFLAFAIASAAPDSVGPVVALDGAPFGAALANPAATPESMIARATLVRARASAQGPESVEPSARMMFAPMLTRPEDLERVLVGVLGSVPSSVGQAIYELMTTDLRPRIAAITTPVLLIVASDHFAGQADRDLGPYEAQLASIADHRVTIAEGTRHFVMIDAPDFVYGEIDRFLARRAR